MEYFPVTASESGFQFGESSWEDNHFKNAFRWLRETLEGGKASKAKLSPLQTPCLQTWALQMGPPHCSKAALARKTLSKLFNKAQMTTQDLAFVSFGLFCTWPPAILLGQLFSLRPRYYCQKAKTESVSFTSASPAWNRAWHLGEVQWVLMTAWTLLPWSVFLWLCQFLFSTTETQ